MALSPLWDLVFSGSRFGELVGRGCGSVLQGGLSRVVWVQGPRLEVWEPGCSGLGLRVVARVLLA